MVNYKKGRKAMQIDKMSFIHRRLISNLTLLRAVIRSIVLVIDAICEITGEIRLEVLPDRTIENIKRFIGRNV